MTEKLIRPFHIALFLPSLAGGGAQRVTLSLAQGLIQVGGIRVDLVLGRAEGPFLKDIPSGVRLIDLKKSRMLATVFPLARYLQAEKPDALLSALDYANVAAIIASSLSLVKIKTAVVTHVHLSSALTRCSLWEKSIFQFLIRRTYPHAYSIVAVSHGVAADMAQIIRLQASQIRVIYNPVVEQDIMDKAQQSTNHPWLSATDRPVIVAVGRLTAEKDFAMLLHAFALMKQRSPSRLIILGEGEQRDELQQLIIKLDLEEIVDMPGFVSNPYRFMSRASVVVLSSRWEALPTVIIEAMRLGIPVVSTDCPCGPNEVLAGGKYGRLVPVGDIPAMASALLDAVQGNLPPPPPESWKPYLVETATKEYLQVFGINFRKSALGSVCEADSQKKS